MSEDKGFTVNDRRRVKMDESAVDTGEKAQTEEAGPGRGRSGRPRRVRAGGDRRSRRWTSWGLLSDWARWP